MSKSGIGYHTLRNIFANHYIIWGLLWFELISKKEPLANIGKRLIIDNKYCI